jgi:ubiquitin carboxyl-terminal hydrolase 36/42
MVHILLCAGPPHLCTVLMLVQIQKLICLIQFQNLMMPSLSQLWLTHALFCFIFLNKVVCMRCHHESERYENIMDLTLEINGWVESLEDALTQFTSPEDLDGENMYKCERYIALKYTTNQDHFNIHLKLSSIFFSL